ncbi:MAG TPA: sensor histidine kinase [Anaerolineales bacterium]|nr:sensor histidine kinase [Anaerolineales bacterium]
MPPKKLIQDPIIWLIAIVWGCLAIFIYTRMQSPWDGALWSDINGNATFELVAADQTFYPGYQVGTKITEIENVSVADYAQFLLWEPQKLPQFSLDPIQLTLSVNGIEDVVLHHLRPTGFRLHPDLWGPLIYGFLGLLIVGVLLVSRPNEEALRVSFFGLSCNFSYALIANHQLTIGQLMQPALMWFRLALIIVLPLFYFSAIVHQGLVFPKRHSIIIKYPLLQWMPYLFLMLGFIVFAVFTRSFVSHTVWLLIWQVYYFIVQIFMLPLTIWAYYTNYRETTNPILRVQAKWVSVSAIIASMVGFCVFLLFLANVVTDGVPSNFTLLIRNLQWLVSLAPVIALLWAVSRFHLYKLHSISRQVGKISFMWVFTFVFMGIWSGLLDMRALATVFLPTVGDLYGAPPSHLDANLLVMLLTSGAFVVSFLFLRYLFKKVVNWFDGATSNPDETLMQFGRSLEQFVHPRQIGQHILQILHENFNLQYSEIRLNTSPEGQFAEYEVLSAIGSLPQGDSAKSLISFPVVYQENEIGQLRLKLRRDFDSLSEDQEELIRNLIHQVGMALYIQQQTERESRLTEQVQASREKLVAAREDERRRLRRDLHDGLGPNLAAMMLRVEAIQDDLADNKTDSSQQELQSLHADLQSTLNEVRRLVQGLRPETLDQMGLKGALQLLAQNHQKPGLKLSLKMPDELPTLSAAHEVAILRIASEAVNNVMRHANASVCELELRYQEGEITLAINDNGNGTLKPNPDGVGLQSIQERTAELGGQFSMTSKPQMGTLLSVRFSLLGLL